MGLYLALFVVFHLCVNGLVIFPAQYRLVVERMHGNKLLVGLVSLLLVMIPLGVQVTTGVLRLLQGGFRGQCRHGPVPPWVQRLSGLVVLIFLPTHLLVTKLVAPFSASAPLETTSRAMIFPTGSSLINGVLALGGLVALWAIVVHVANGVSTALRFIRSNPSQRAQVSWRILCVVGGIMLLTVGLSGWVTFLSASRSTHSVPSVESKTHG